jgi:hypothetical protein
MQTENNRLWKPYAYASSCLQQTGLQGYTIKCVIAVQIAAVVAIVLDVEVGMLLLSFLLLSCSFLRAEDVNMQTENHQLWQPYAYASSCLQQNGLQGYTIKCVIAVQIAAVVLTIVVLVVVGLLLFLLLLCWM